MKDGANQNDQILYFPIKDKHFSDTILNSKHQYIKMEIVPKVLESITISDFIKFEFITFLNFN